MLSSLPLIVNPFISSIHEYVLPNNVLPLHGLHFFCMVTWVYDNWYSHEANNICTSSDMTLYNHCLDQPMSVLYEEDMYCTDCTDNQLPYYTLTHTCCLIATVINSFPDERGQKWIVKLVGVGSKVMMMQIITLYNCDRQKSISGNGTHQDLSWMGYLSPHWVLIS